MRHLHTGRKLGVDNSHRLAMLRSLTLALIEKETIRTTPARAKELRWWADRIITLAKRGDLNSRRRIVQLLGSTQTYKTGENRVRKALDRVYSDLAPRFKDRPGGYTQMFRLALRRPGDNAEMCLMRYLPGDAGDKAEAKATKSAAKVKTAAKKKAPEKKEGKTKKATKAKAKA
jgi:large subunit ribosomal protein L17